MQKVISSYQSFLEEERDQALAEILSNEEDRKTIELWIRNHPIDSVVSPMLADLRNRITPAEPGLFSRLIAIARDFFYQPDPSVEIESKIIAGKFGELIDDFKRSPNILSAQIDLIKTHLELKTIKDIDALLPLLLDHVSAKDIAAVLQAAEPLTTLPSSLSHSQLLRLSAVLPIEATVELPPIAMQFRNIVEIKAIKNLEGLTAAEKDAALAHYIERHKISLADVKKQLSDEEFLRLAPHLRYVDFRDFENSALAQQLLINCPNLNSLLIRNGNILKGIEELPFCQYLDCSECSLKELPALPLCQKLVCIYCSSLTVLPELPHCQALNCVGCRALNSLPALPLCQELTCRDCENLSYLPALPLCQNLCCSWCRALKRLPALPQCQSLDCCGCSALNTLPDLPLCQKLSCQGCSPLTALPSLSLCQELNCSYCPAISELPPLPLCQVLTCRECTAISSLPALTICKELYCNGCTALSSLPALPLCQQLCCFGCTALSSLPALPLCQKLDVHWCADLNSLPALPLCQKLDVHGCIALRELPALPLCRWLNCYLCPLAELPEIPWNARVVTDEDGFVGLPIKPLDVDIEKLTQEPVSLLLKLGEFLLNDMPFPNIYYFEKGQRHQVVDCGGVRRDFVTKLCFNLFKENGLKLEDNIPIITSDNEEIAYSALGSLLAQCHPVDSYYKTGSLFDPAVYQCLLIPNPGSNEWFLASYLILLNAPDAFRQMIDLNQEVPALEDLTLFAYLAEPDATDISKYTQDYFSDFGNRKKISLDLLLRARQDPRLKAISWMAHELRRKNPHLAGNLKERIEGVLNQEALKRKLSWTLTRPNDLRFIKTQEYLTHWIENHEDQLEKFVYAVTGIRTLSAENLKIGVYDRDKDFIPVAHTCSFSLELSANYKNQTVFDQKIKYFLENALAGSGFSMA